jgi:hypothetical protein
MIFMLRRHDYLIFVLLGVQSLSDQIAKSADFKTLIESNKQCSSLVMSIWMAAKGAAHPVWIATKPGIASLADTLPEPPSDAVRSACLDTLVKGFGGLSLTYSTHKAADARSELFW